MYNICGLLYQTSHQFAFNNSCTDNKNNNNNNKESLITLVNGPIRTRSKCMQPAPSAENACERGTITFDFAFHWLRKWYEFR